MARNPTVDLLTILLPWQGSQAKIDPENRQQDPARPSMAWTWNTQKLSLDQVASSKECPSSFIAIASMGHVMLIRRGLRLKRFQIESMLGVENGSNADLEIFERKSTPAVQFFFSGHCWKHPLFLCHCFARGVLRTKKHAALGSNLATNANRVVSFSCLLWRACSIDHDQ